jgi:hypothetical protein
MKGNNMKTKTLLLSVLMSLFCGNLFSQEEGTIIYTDFEPDSIIFPVNYCSSGCNPIDVNYDESSFRMFIYNIIWGMIGAIDGICSIVRNIPKNKIRPIIPYRQRIPTKTLPFIVLRSVTTYL